MPRPKGFTISEETRKRMSEGALRRAPRKFSKQACKNMSIARLGKPGTPHTPESKRKLAIANGGSNNYRWKGGRKINRAGYVMLLMPDHPNAYKEKRGDGEKKGRYVLEHRVVMSEILGRPLDRWDIIHHMNGIKTDNRPENLQHLRGDNYGCHLPLVCPKCGHAF